jgi:hypothetical protein
VLQRSYLYQHSTLTGSRRLSLRHPALELCTPVTRRRLTECLDKKGGSHVGEKVFVLKFSEELLKA